MIKLNRFLRRSILYKILLLQRLSCSHINFRQEAVVSVDLALPVQWVSKCFSRDLHWRPQLRRHKGASKEITLLIEAFNSVSQNHHDRDREEGIAKTFASARHSWMRQQSVQQLRIMQSRWAGTDTFFGSSRDDQDATEKDDRRLFLTTSKIPLVPRRCRVFGGSLYFEDQ